jgi:uncharacterized damage-inducible protein DinB
MRAIELFPYWEHDRALLLEMIANLADEHLAFRIQPGFPSLGGMLRHLITTEEHWWHGGILGEPYPAWRPEGWERWTAEEKEAYRARRFPTVASIREGLRAAHAPVVAFLCDLDAWALCEKRVATWGESNTLRWIFWHLVEHDQHHRAQIAVRLRLLGYRLPPLVPHPAVMAQTPAVRWRPGEVETKHIVPYWDDVHTVLRDAVAPLAAPDLAYRPSGDLPTVHDLVLHIIVWEDFLMRQVVGGERIRHWWRIEGSWWQMPLGDLGAQIGARFPSGESLVEALDRVHAHTNVVLGGLTIADLVRTHPMPWGEATTHYILWYAREHTVHHRAQLFLWLRMLGRLPPDV